MTTLKWQCFDPVGQKCRAALLQQVRSQAQDEVVDRLKILRLEIQPDSLFELLLAS